MLHLQEQHARYIEEKRDNDRKGQQQQQLVLQLEKLKHDYCLNLERIHALDKEIETLKPELQASLAAQIYYYYGLLKTGEETRNVGLSWVVKAILYLEGKSPSVLKYPKFVDCDEAQTINKVHKYISTSSR